MKRSFELLRVLWIVIALAIVLSPATVAQTAPFICNGEAYIIQGDNGVLSRVDQSMSPDFTFIEVQPPMGIGAGDPVNAIGFRRSDGLLYGWTSEAPFELVTVDANSVLNRLGVPMSVGDPMDPSDDVVVPQIVFNAGDVRNEEGTSTYYLSDSGGDPGAVDQNLYIIDLADPLNAVRKVAIAFGSAELGVASPARGNVPDLAYNPVDGLLYGADEDGDIAKIDPETGIRTEWQVLGSEEPNLGDPLPAGDYGGAWFDAGGTLFVYENGTIGDQSSGLIYAVDMNAETWKGPTMGPGSERNDGAACAVARIGAAKSMTAPVQVAPPLAFPVDVTITYTFENFSISEDLFLLSALDDLTDTFGDPSQWSILEITSSQAGLHNPDFNGSNDPELINQTPTQSIPPSPDPMNPTLITIDVTVRVISNTDGRTEYCNQIEVTGNTNMDGTGIVFGDFSVAGMDPDPDGNGSPSENQQTCISAPAPPPPAQIGDLVWQDTNGNGIFDGGEPGLGGVVIELRDGACTPGATCPTRTTSASGLYLFDGLPPGSYTVDVIAGVPAGFVLTTGNDPLAIALATDEIFLDADFGYQPQTSVAAIKSSTFDPATGDQDGNGVLSPGDVLSYAIVIENLGPNTALDVMFSDTPDPNTTLVAGTVITSVGTVTSGNAVGEMEVGVDIGNMAVGAMVTVSFDVTINDPLPDGVTEVVNQGDVNGSNFPPVTTDDPDTPDDDPTRDPIPPMPPPSVPEIPTVSDWGIFFLSLLLAAGGLFVLRRRSF